MTSPAAPPIAPPAAPSLAQPSRSFFKRRPSVMASSSESLENQNPQGDSVEKLAFRARGSSKMLRHCLLSPPPGSRHGPHQSNRGSELPYTQPNAQPFLPEMLLKKKGWGRQRKKSFAVGSETVISDHDDAALGSRDGMPYLGGLDHSFNPLLSGNPSKGPSPLDLWWHSLDRWFFVGILFLMALGVWLIMAVSPAVALQHNWGALVLLKRHGQILLLALILLLFTTILNARGMVIGARWVLVAAWLGVVIVCLCGTEIKGARRWLNLGGFSLQPSEFLKPALAIVVADILGKGPHFLKVFALTAAISLPLCLQPDVGMTVTVWAMVFMQCFVRGLPWVWIGSGFMGFAGVLTGSYFAFPHVARRLSDFFAPSSQDPFGAQYQILQGLKSFASGGWLGKGPGAGTVLNHLPDGHCDFIFAVAGEELGIVVCAFILMVYGALVLRGFWFAFKEDNGFYSTAIVGLSSYFGFQVFINIASVLHLMPTKGMTLPLLSYGGSSLLSTAWALGLLLAITRRYREIL